MDAPTDDRDVEALLEYLKASRAFDFGGYKRASLVRRIRHRMQAVRIDQFGDYRDYLEIHPDEFTQLFNTILINVTSFFRDAETWDYLAAKALPQLLQTIGPDQPIRVWSAGCASGEEAYSAAILLAELLGEEAFRSRVKIYGTDVDEEALKHARQPAYLAKAVEAVKPELRARYFESGNNVFCFRKELRRSVIFGRVDLIQDAPISPLDWLICRNTLMYFNAETQARILNRFHFALNEHGLLFLGKAEMLLANYQKFNPLDLPSRIFLRQGTGPRERIWPAGTLLGETGPPGNHGRLREAAFETATLAQVVIDRAGLIVLANSQARVLLKLGTQDVGRPLKDFEFSYRPTDLRSCIDRALTEGVPQLLSRVEWPQSAGGLNYFDIQATPLRLARSTEYVGIGLTFADVTGQRHLQTELKHTTRERQVAYEELQSTNEELETTNEELQSTNEELETTNEELQSTNEELETMNEELQSANQELQAMNVELRQRGDELDQVNGFLESILASLRGGAVLLDRDLLIQIWDHRAEDLWGLRSDEVRGKPFFNLDIGLPVEQLKPSIRACLNGEATQRGMLVEATNRRGKKIQCQVTCTPLADRSPEKKPRGVIVLMEEKDASKPA